MTPAILMMSIIGVIVAAGSYVSGRYFGKGVFIVWAAISAICFYLWLNAETDLDVRPAMMLLIFVGLPALGLSVVSGGFGLYVRSRKSNR